jgi:signal transduction histidine kinase
MKIKSQQQVYIYFIISFALFAGFILALLMNREKTLKTEIIESCQMVYAHSIHAYITQNQLIPEHLDSLNLLLRYFPDNLSITIIGEDVEPLFTHSTIPEANTENLNQLPEINKAILYGKGWSIRESPVSRRQYTYYAVYTGDYIIHTALPYDNKIKQDKVLVVFAVFLFISAVFFFFLIYSNFRKSIQRLQDFILSLFYSRTDPDDVALPNDEFGKIGRLITDIYNKLELNEKRSILEREKLLEHFHFSNEGISFFTPAFEKIYTNTHFIQYLNILLNEPTLDATNLFQSPVFSEVLYFIENPGKENVFNSKLYGNGHHFLVQVIIFNDKSFEIIIREMSEMEKSTFDQTKMANNIAHELRTPVTSIRGYLETLIEHENISSEKRNDFIQRAYGQILRLSEILQDVILLTKTSYAPHIFPIENINIRQLLKDMIEVDSKEIIQKRNCTVLIKVPDHVTVRGNPTLLRSIFYNLGNNALKYAGENITVTIHNYMEDDEYYYFSFSDNGIGIEDKYLKSIFERFYRITEGRSRDKGGSGLGLSIVKDAVSFHHGVIQAKNRSEGGLEFLFTLKK